MTIVLLVKSLFQRGRQKPGPQNDLLGIYLRLIGYVRPYVFPELVFTTILLVILGGSNGAIPFLAKRFIDQLSSLRNMEAVHMLSLEMLAVWLIRALSDFGSDYLTSYIGMRTAFDIRAQFNDRLQTLPVSFFNWTPTGGLITRSLNDVQMASSVITRTLFSLIGDSMTLVGLVVAVLIADWKLALIAFAVFPLAVLPVVRITKRVRSMTKEAARQLSDLSVLLQESAQGCRVVKAFGMEEYERERYRQQIRRQVRIARRILRISTSTNPVIEVLAAFGVLGVLWFGSTSVLHGSRSPGTFGAFVAAMLLIYKPFKGIAGTNNSIQQGLISAQRVFDIIDYPPETENTHAIELHRGPHEIEFRNVSFRYAPDAPLVLRDINLRIKVGEVIAIVGMSGGGKSTLTDLIPRFYDPEAGGVFIDGTDTRKFSIKSLRAEIGVVGQNTFLFNDTVRMNISYGNPAKNQDEIVAAAKLANADDFITRLPNGYDTLVGEFGIRLSGGERQRLAIARALLKNAPILILDEPTSNLDSEAEHVVRDAIERLMVGRTTLLIAHRLSTVSRADKLFVMVNGQIVEEGTHMELYKNKGHYRKLCDLQIASGSAQD
jgi:subfamily B ATP-binding cassette protein MsbA